MSRRALEWRVRSGRWQRVLPRVYALFSGSLTRRQQLIAAFLYGGTAAQISGAAALQWHGFRYGPSDERVHVLIPVERHLAAAGFAVINRTTRPDPRPWKAGVVTVVSPARAVADVARVAKQLDDVRAIVAEAVQRELATVADLRRELDLGPRRGSAHLRTAIEEVAAGTRSAPEAQLRRLVAASRLLPEALWNPMLTDTAGRRLPTPDGYFVRTGIALEVDSKAHHTSPRDWEATMRRHNRLAAHGVLVLHFSPSRIRTEPHSVLAEIERAHLERDRSRVKPTIVCPSPR